MTSRKRQQNMANENKTRNYAAQSPKDLSNESVDDMLANVESFIEGVYRDLSISPPRSSIGNTTTFRTRRSLGDSSFSSANSSPDGAASLPVAIFAEESDAGVTSPTTRRNMDAEIERINRICDNVDQNLRSIGLYMNTSDDMVSNVTGEGENILSHSSSSDSPPISRPVRNNNTQRSRPRRRRSSPIGSVAVATHVIDLSESQTQTPEVHRYSSSIISSSNRHVDDDDDDDVILVSANIHPVVDLCTPGGLQDQSNYRPTINQRQLNRRRLAHQDDEVADSCCQGPSVMRKRRTEHVTPPKLRKTSSDTTGIVDTSPPTSSGTTASGHTPFMCPVCMESCLQRQPTSTRCGHVFCKECIEHAIRLTHKCPMCNTKISKSQIFRIYL